jgi:UDP-N-acetylmuramoyl-L-alanyl-D-glutamate--2,6-diaminopimelate ligase
VAVSASRRVGDLLRGIAGVTVSGGVDREIALVTADSRRVVPDALFAALRGAHVDGHRFLDEAVARGAAAIAGEDGDAIRRVPGPTELVRVVVPSGAAWFGMATARWWGDPSHRLGMIGVTGTNGKTTTTHLIRSIYEAAGRRTGLIGTVAYAIGEEIRPASHTTPHAEALHALLAEMLGRGVTDVVMEVSSHALAQDRTAGCAFDAGVFTNLTQDHLDFHGTMDAYAAAKRRLFESLGTENPKAGPRLAVINRDDPRWSEMARASREPVWTFGVAPDADVRPESVSSTVEGIRCRVRTPKGSLDLTSPLLGSYNLSNLLAATATAVGQGVAMDAVRDGVARMARVPGRFEKVDLGQDFTVVVDYAHTEDALQRVLAVARELCRGRLMTVFGCGGDRDPGKRAPMGRVAARVSDLVIVTSDNPRGEDPLAIITAIEQGLRGELAARAPARPSAFSRQPYLTLPDRREAIERAVQMAEPGDLIVIAGKGHEDYQIVGQRRLPFDDRAVAREAIEQRLAHRARTA